jgi:hypothetical protein
VVVGAVTIRNTKIVVTHGLLSGVSSTFERVEPADLADSVDEYRDLATLADAWERGSLEPHAAEGAPERVAAADNGKESALP